jgi:ABC-type iron transport system FetAB ATPase subunit
MRAEATIANLRLNDGTVIDLPDRGVVLIVGPDNAGRSQFLRDVATLVSSPAEAGVVVVGASIQRIGAAEVSPRAARSSKRRIKTICR